MRLTPHALAASLFTLSTLATARQPATSAPASSQLAFPSFGIAFPSPAGYTRRLERTPSVICKLFIRDAQDRDIHSLDLQVAKLTAGKTTPELIKDMVPPGAELKQTTWAGLEAWEIITPPSSAKDGWYRPRQIFTTHEGISYGLTYATVPGGENLDHYDRIKADTKWSPRASVVDAIAPRGTKVPIGPNLLADLPDPLRPKAPTPDNKAYAATDLTTNKAAINLVHTLPTPASSYKSIADAQAGFKPIGGNDTIIWTPSANGLSTRSNVVLSPSVGRCQGVLVQSRPDLVELFLFAYNLPPADAQKAAKAAEIFAESIELKK